MPRTLLIGIDGGTFDVLEPLWEDGVMPRLRELVRGGARAELQSVVPPLTPPAWTSLVTGRSPGHHGIFDFVRVKRGPDGGMQYRMATSSDIQAETIWSIASRQDRLVATLNFPVAFPPQRDARFWISGFVPWRHLRRAVHPPEFYERLRELPGFDPKRLVLDLELERKAIQALDPDEYEEWITFHIERELRWLDVVRLLVEEDDGCDLIAVLLDGMDKLSHLCWRFFAPLPDGASEWEHGIRKLCLRYFETLDGVLAELAAATGPDPRVIIASDHGSGGTVELFYVNVWLSEHGYLRWADDVASDQVGNLTMPESTRSSSTLFDWAGTRACALTSGSNGIHLNVASRPGEPGVAPEDRAALCEQIREGLLAYTDPVDGGHVVTRVHTREEAFPGPCADDAPDLTLELRDGGFVSILRGPAPLRPRSEIMGAHRPRGIFIAHGPGVRRGVTLPALSILDIAPTVLYSLGLPVPADLEGRVPEEVFDDAQLDRDPPLIGAPTLGARDAESTVGVGVTAHDEEILTDRLKALGYLE